MLTPIRRFVPSPVQVGFRAGKTEEPSHRASCSFFSWCAKACVRCHLLAGAGERRNGRLGGRKWKKRGEKLAGEKESGRGKKGMSKGKNKALEGMNQRSSHHW